jgi:hypothetical protein
MTVPLEMKMSSKPGPLLAIHSEAQSHKRRGNLLSTEKSLVGHSATSQDFALVIRTS